MREATIDDLPMNLINNTPVSSHNNHNNNNNNREELMKKSSRYSVERTSTSANSKNLNYEATIAHSQSEPNNYAVNANFVNENELVPSIQYEMNSQNSQLTVSTDNSPGRTTSLPSLSPLARRDSQTATNNIPPSHGLISNASAKYLQQWLFTNRFANLIPIFANYATNDFLRLSKDDLIKLCYPPDAIRCYNLAHNIQVGARMKIFITFENQDFFTAVYLDDFNKDFLYEKIISMYLNRDFCRSVSFNAKAQHSDERAQIKNDCKQLDRSYFGDGLFLKAKGIVIKVTDEVLANFQDETKFMVHYESSSSQSTYDYKKNYATQSNEMNIKSLSAHEQKPQFKLYMIQLE